MGARGRTLMAMAQALIALAEQHAVAVRFRVQGLNSKLLSGLLAGQGSTGGQTLGRVAKNHKNLNLRCFQGRQRESSALRHFASPAGCAGPGLVSFSFMG